MRTWLIVIACLALGCAPSPVAPTVAKPPSSVTVTVPMFSVSAVTLDVGDTLVIATQDGTPWGADYAEGIVHQTAPWTWTVVKAGETWIVVTEQCPIMPIPCGQIQQWTLTVRGR